jgi:general secretion pathway protein K
MANKRQSGSALLVVLWLTAALAAIGLAVANNVRGETERAATGMDDVKAYFVAKGAIERALLHMNWGPDFYEFAQPGFDFTFPDAQAHVDIIPEASKLSMNVSRPEEVQRLLMALGQSEDRAIAITQAILDWRSSAPASGDAPSDSFYLSRSPSFLPRHASFQENEELLLVKGVTPDLYFGTSLDGSRAGLRDCLSAHSGGYAVDVNSARAETMIAIGIDPEDAATIVKNRATRPITEWPELAEIQQSLGPAGARLRIGRGGMFTLRATAVMRRPDGRLSDLKRTVAVLIKEWAGNNPFGKRPGFEVVRWYDRG